MNKIMLVFLLLPLPLVALGTADPQAAKEAPLMTKDLPDVPGKEGLIEKVVLAPGQVVPAHRHNADVFVYVLEGSILTRLEGGQPQTVRAGEVFYESPADVHIASGNASTTQSATLLVFAVKKIGAPLTLYSGKANSAP